MNLRIPILAAVLFSLLLPRHSLAQEPSCPAFGLFSPSQTNNSVSFNWNNGCGNGRLVLVAPVGSGVCSPMDGIVYGSNPDYGVAPPVCGPWRAVSSGPMSSVMVTGLASSTAYDFMVFEYNDFGSIDYRVFDAPLATFSTTGGGGGGPSVQAGLGVVSVDAGSVSLTITLGNGQATLVGAEPGTSFTGFPANNFKYCVNNSYASAQPLNGGGGLARAVGLHRHGLCGAGVDCSENPQTFIVTDLTPGATYTFKAFEFEGCSSPSYNLNDGFPSPVTVDIPFNQPTTQATNLSFSSVTTTSMTVSWANGDGQNRILVVSPATPVTFLPADGTAYSANANYTLGPDLGGGQKVLYAGPNASVNISGLLTGITYHFRVFEANSPTFGSFTNYLTNTASGNPASRSTLFAEPTVLASGLGSSAIATNSVTLNWTSGNGTSRMVIMDDGPLTFVPMDGISYSAISNYASGTDLGSGTKCVYNGSGSSVAITGLGVGLQYNFMVIEYNGSSLTTNYLYPGTSGPFGTLSPEPSSQGNTISFSSVSINAMTVSWTNGNGNQRIVVARASSAVSFVPVDGANYGPNSNFSTAVDQGSGNKVVYNGNGSSVDVTGLASDVNYHFRVFEYNLFGPFNPPNYLTSTATGNPSSRSTLAPNVTTQASGIAFTSVQATSLSLNWTSGNGASRMVVMDDQVITFAPSNGSTYAANANYSVGTDLGNGQKCVFNGTGNSVSITGLSANTTYHFRVFEYNGSGLTSNYNVATATNNPNSQITLVSEPTTQASAISINSSLTTGFTASWTPGNGANRIVIVDDGAITFIPTDATTIAANPNYGAGIDLGGGQKCVYNGSGTSVPITGLATNTSYSIRVYEYNGTLTQINYLTTTATGNPVVRKTLVAEPAAHAAGFIATAVSSAQNNLSFSAANTITNASGYILLRRSDGADPTSAGVNDGQSPGSLPLVAGTMLVSVISSGATMAYNDIGLASGIQYNYALIPYGFDGTNNETYNYRTAAIIPVANATTFVVEPPAQPTDLAFSSVTPTSFTISFTPPGTAPAGYLVVRKTVSSPSSAIPVDGTSYSPGANLGDALIVYIGTNPTFNESGLTPATQYFYDVFAYNGTGGLINYLNASPLEGSRTTFSNQPSNQPTAINFGSVTASTLTLSFTASVGGADGYLVLRSGTAPTGVPSAGTTYAVGNAIGDGVVVSLGATLSILESGLSSNTTYYYAVLAYNGNGASINYLTTTALAGSQLTLPPKPNSLGATTLEQTSFNANWEAVGGISDFYIDVSSDNFSTYAPGYQDQLINGTTLTVGGLASGTNYKYRVRAGNAAGQSVNSDDQSALTKPATPTTSGPAAVTQSGFTAAWDPVTGADNFHLDIATDNGYTSLLTGYNNLSLPGTTLTASVTGLPSGTTYYYRVRSSNQSGTSPNSSTVTVPTIPAAPTIDIPTDNRTSNSFLVTWTAISGATNYFLDVYDISSTPVFVTGYQNKSVTGTFHNVTGLNAETNYQVILRSANSSGSSNDSNTKFTQTKDATGTDDPAPTVNLGGTASVNSVSANVTDGTDPKTIVFFHRKITDTAPPIAESSVEVASGTYLVNVASADVDEIGMEYYFEVTDFIGRKSTSPKGYVYRTISNQALPNLSVGGRVENYRIFSIPLDYGGSNNISDIFASVIAQFQGYNKEKWRLLRYQGNKNVDYTEGLQRIEKAKGYWFNSVEAIDLQVSGTIIQANQDTPFILQLDDGWNQIGNPFTFDISWSDVRAKNPAATGVGPLYVYNPSIKFDQNDNLRAWGGGFVHSDGATTISIPVTVAHASGRLQSERVSANLGSATWFVPLKVVQGVAVNDIGGIGMNPSASNSKDLFDELSLPRFVNYLELNGYHPEYKWTRFMRDVVTTANSYTWNLKVESNFGGPETTLVWDNADFGDNDSKLILFDVDAQVMVDMRLSSSYTFMSQSEKNLKMVYARSASDFAPGFSSLGQPYPNPFSNQIYFPAIVDGQSNIIELFVYDMVGRSVWAGNATGLAGGIHQLVWDGNDFAGSRLPDGVYVYRVRINDGSVRLGRIVLKKN